MIIFPKNLTATKYRGYYWNVVNGKLYSIKVGGELRELKKLKPTKFNTSMRSNVKYYFVVSVNGLRKTLVDSYLESLKLENSVIPYRY